MADKVPIRAGLDGSSVTGLAIFASGETIGIAHGGTGLATVGSNQLVTGNGTSAMTSESNLTFDGSTLKSTGAVCATGNLVVGGNTSLDGGTFTFNDSGADVDFRIEGDSEANLFVADASVDRIGIGTATPSHLVDIEGVAHAATCFVSADVCATTKVVTPALCVGSQYALPAADGSAGEILCTDGSGAITFAEAASSGHTIAEEGSVLASRTCLNFVGAGVTATDNSGTNATDVTVCATNALLGFRVAAGTACTITLSNAAVGTCLQSDTAPKLGGNLDVNSNSIISASNGNIPITPNGSGIVILDGICHPTADGSAGQVLCTNGSAALQWATIASTSPGGSDTHVQFNDGGSFGGASGLTWDDTTFKASNICTPGTATIATVTATSLGGTLTTAAQTAVTSVGTLSSLVVSGALTVDTNTLKVDNHNNRVGIGTASPDTTLHLYSSGAGDPKIKIENTNADQHEGMLHFYKTGASPADADAIGSVGFYATNLEVTETLFGDMKAYTDDVTAGTEDGSIRFRTIKAGTLTDTMSVVSGSVGIGITTISDCQGGTSNKLVVANGDLTLLNTTCCCGAEVPGALVFRSCGELGCCDFEYASIGLLPETTARGGECGSLIFKTAKAASLGERVRITSGGCIGIGTTAPAAALHTYNIDKGLTVEGNDNATITIKSTCATRNAYLYFANTADAKCFDIVNNSYDPGSGTNQLRFSSSDTPCIMVFNQDGGVGIGTAAPVGGDQGSLSMYKDASNYVRVWDNAVATLTMRSTGANSPCIQLTNSDADQLDITVFQRSNAGGNLFGYGRNGMMSIIAGSSLQCGLFIGTYGAHPLLFGTSNAVRGCFGSNGTFHASNTCLYGTLWGTNIYGNYVGGRYMGISSGAMVGYISSTCRHKTNIVDSDDNAEWILQAQPRKFQMRKKDDEGNILDEADGGTKYGFIAEELREIAPDEYFRDYINDDDTVDGIDFFGLSAPIIKMIQKMHTRIETLETQVAALS